MPHVSPAWDDSKSFQKIILLPIHMLIMSNFQCVCDVCVCSNYIIVVNKCITKIYILYMLIRYHTCYDNI